MSEFFSGYDLTNAEEDKAATLIGSKSMPTYGYKLNNRNGLNVAGNLKFENQGRFNSCTGNAMTTVQEAIAGLQMKGKWSAVPQLSRWFAYVAGQKCWGYTGRDNGCTIKGVVDAAIKYGICEESVYPYPTQYTSHISREHLAAAESRKLKSHTWIDSTEAAFQFLDLGAGAIVIGVPWTSGMAGHRGRFTKATVTTGKVLGGHAMAIVDFNKNGQFYLQNSHGEKSTVVVDPDVIDYWGKNSQSTMIGLSDLSGFDVPRLSKWENGVG